MSLVSTYVQAVDGKFYRNPTIREKDWFLCFDDEEPPELVVKDSLLKTKKPWKILNEARIKHKPEGYQPWKGDRSAGRLFGGKFHPGTGFFIEITARIPVPTHHDGIYDEKPKKQGVYYAWEEKIK